jgi:hypothetical protein
MNLRRLVAGCVVMGAVVPFLARCGGAQADDASSKTPVARQVVEVVEHEACDTSGSHVERFDTRGDGKPVVFKVKDGSGHEICRVTDINHDGKPDLYEYFDSSGNLRRLEADYDSNGTIDAVEFYVDGKLVKREYDTTGQHRVDTWDYFDRATGQRLRRERDTTNDGKVDQWWTWSGDKVTVAFDRNGDGQPDPGAVVVLDAKTGAPFKEGKDAPAAPAASAPAPAPGSAADATEGLKFIPAASASASGPTLENPFGLKNPVGPTEKTDKPENKDRGKSPTAHPKAPQPPPSPTPPTNGANQ